jgi:predicted alpha/beta-hydrolase family hydrolase
MAEPQTLQLGHDRSKGPVSAILQSPENAIAMYVMAHGAGADMRHRFLQSMADELESTGIATLRFNFPYTEQGRKSPDPQPVLEAYVRSACTGALELANGVPIFAGGKSMGGRMTSNAIAKETIPEVRGLIFLGFPLHAPNRPSRDRAAHLEQVPVPMLFLQGTRDDLAEIGLIREVTGELKSRATLHEIEGADHSFEVRKSSGRTSAEVRKDLAATTARWIDQILR